MLRSVIGAMSPWLGVLLMFYSLALARVAGPLLVLRMPDALRAVRPREQGAYERMAVPQFGRLLRDSPLRFLNPSVYVSSRNGRKDLLRIYRQVESTEAIHFWVAVLFTPYIGYVWISGHAKEAFILLLVQVLFNIYPIFHLRLTRGRLHRPLQRRLGLLAAMRVNRGGAQ